MSILSRCSSTRIWYVLLLVVLVGGYVYFSLVYNSGASGLFNDEAIELLVSQDMPLKGFYFFAPGYKGSQIIPLESLVPYVNRLIFSIAGLHLIFIRLFFMLCLALACCFFYRVVERYYSQAYGILGVILLAGSSYTNFYNQILHRNGVTFLWTCAFIWLMYKYMVMTLSGGRRVYILSALPLVVVLSNLTYTPFKFLSPVIYIALVVWTLVYASRKRECLAALLSLGIAALAGYALLRAGGSSVDFILSRGNYVVAKGFGVRLYLSNVARSLLLPLCYSESPDFHIEMTHIGFHRHTLSYVLVPFFAWGILVSLLGSADRTGFQKLILAVWVCGTALLALGGPELKHHYALFPFVILISLFGFHSCMVWLERYFSIGMISWGTIIIVVLFLLSEARHLYWANQQNEAIFLEKRMPRALALTALKRVNQLSRVYLIEQYGKDSLRFYTRHEPRIVYLASEAEQGFQTSLMSDIKNGLTVGIVVNGGIVPRILTQDKNLKDCFERVNETVNGRPVSVYLLNKECVNLRVLAGDKIAEKSGKATPHKKPKMFSIFRKTDNSGKADSLKSPKQVRSEGVHVQILEGKEGDAPGQYKEPRGIAIDSEGNIYVADFRNYRIQRFDRLGTFVTAWGEAGERTGQFKDPCGVAVGMDGQVYVADTFNNRIQVFDGNGKYILHFEGGFYAPRGIAVDEKGRIWVADSGNGVVKLFSGKGEQLKLIGKRGQGKGEFGGPNSIAIDSKGKVYVADTGNRRVQVLDGEGNYVSEFKVDGWQQGVFNEPYLDVDERGDIYLSDPPGNRILKYSQKGKLLGVLKPMEGAEPLLAFPMGIAVEKKGEAIYIVDCRHHRIRKASKKDFR